MEKKKKKKKKRKNEKEVQFETMFAKTDRYTCRSGVWLGGGGGGGEDGRGFLKGVGEGTVSAQPSESPGFAVSLTDCWGNDYSRSCLTDISDFWWG